MPETTFDTRITLTDAGRAAVYSPALPIEAEAICADCGADCCDCVCSLYPSREELDAMQARTLRRMGSAIRQEHQRRRIPQAADEVAQLLRPAF